VIALVARSERFEDRALRRRIRDRGRQEVAQRRGVDVQGAVRRADTLGVRVAGDARAVRSRRRGAARLVVGRGQRHRQRERPRGEVVEAQRVQVFDRAVDIDGGDEIALHRRQQGRTHLLARLPQRLLQDVLDLRVLERRQRAASLAVWRDRGNGLREQREPHARVERGRRRHPVGEHEAGRVTRRHAGGRADRRQLDGVVGTRQGVERTVFNTRGECRSQQGKRACASVRAPDAEADPKRARRRQRLPRHRLLLSAVCIEGQPAGGARGPRQRELAVCL